MITNPTTVVTMDDWVASVVPVDRKRKPFVVGMSPPSMTEAQAFELIEEMLVRRKVGQADVTLRRRWQKQWQRKPTDPRLLERYRA